MNCPWVPNAGGIPCVPKSHNPFYYLGASQTDALPAILPSPLCFPPSLRGWTLLWTVSRVSYWCNWKCFVIALSQTLMDVKLNEVWVLVIRVSLRKIYHQRLKRLQGTIKAPPASTSQWTVHYYSLKQNTFNMSSFPCGKKTHTHTYKCWRIENIQLPGFTVKQVWCIWMGFFERVCKILKCPWNLKKSEFKKNKLFLSLCVLFLINALNFALLKLSIEKWIAHIFLNCAINNAYNNSVKLYIC